MAHLTTVRMERVPTVTLRAPELGTDGRRLAAIAVHLATAVILAASIATAVATSGDRVTGSPSRLDEPATIVRPAVSPESIAPQPEPTPQPGF